VKAEPSAGVRAFLFTWRALGGEPSQWVREYRFALAAVGFPTRGIRKALAAAGLSDWRFDLADPYGMLAVEIDGGTWVQGRHTRGAGYESDCRKINAATAMGWRVWRFTTAMASDPDAVEQIMAACATEGGQRR